MAIVVLTCGGRKAPDGWEVHEWSLHVTHCNMKAYSTSFATQFKTKTGKPGGDSPSPLIFYTSFQWQISMKGVPQRVNYKKDTRWLLTVEIYFNYHFHIFYLGFLHEICESQKTSNNHFWTFCFQISIRIFTQCPQWNNLVESIRTWYCGTITLLR